MPCYVSVGAALVATRAEHIDRARWQHQWCGAARASVRRSRGAHVHACRSNTRGCGNMHVPHGSEVRPESTGPHHQWPTCEPHRILLQTRKGNSISEIWCLILTRIPSCSMGGKQCSMVQQHTLRRKTPPAPVPSSSTRRAASLPDDIANRGQAAARATRPSPKTPYMTAAPAPPACVNSWAMLACVPMMAPLRAWAGGAGAAAGAPEEGRAEAERGGESCWCREAWLYATGCSAARHTYSMAKTL